MGIFDGFPLVCSQLTSTGQLLLVSDRGEFTKPGQDETLLAEPHAGGTQNSHQLRLIRFSIVVSTPTILQPPPIVVL